MMKKVLIPCAVLWLILVPGCDGRRGLRETLAERTFEIGFVGGMIFTLDAAAGFLAGTLTAAEINLEEEVMHNWEAYGRSTMILVCDSLGVVFDSALSNVLLSIYTHGFSAGIVEGERYMREDFLADSTDDEMDELVMARSAYRMVRTELLMQLERVELTRREPVSP